MGESVVVSGLTTVAADRSIRAADAVERFSGMFADWYLMIFRMGKKMQAEVSMTYSNEYGVEEVRSRGLRVLKSDAHETRFALGGDMGCGVFSSIALGRGFRLWLHDCRFDRPVTFRTDKFPPMFAFCFFVEGRSEGRLTVLDRTLSMNGGRNGIYYFPESMGCSMPSVGEAFRSISVTMCRKAFCSLLGGEIDRIPQGLQKIVRGERSEFYAMTGANTPAMLVAIHQMLNCPLEGQPRRLFLESRCMELIAYQIGNLIGPCRGGRGCCCMGQRDRKRVDHARSLLLADLENPPGLMEIARAVGLSHARLNRRFREVYGTTLFGYLRDARLDRARRLFDEGNLNVTEVAYSVGYSSPSHFTKAFKGRYGVLPKKYLEGNLPRSPR